MEAVSGLIYIPLISILAAGLGAQVLQWLGFSFVSRLEKAVLGFALGMGILSQVVFALGELGLIRRDVALVLIVVAGLVSWRQVVELVSWVIVRVRDIRRPRVVTVTTILLALVLVHLTLNGLAALAPPSDGDSLRYHLALPKRYIARGEIEFEPVREWAHPSNLQMLYTLAMLLSSEIGAVLTHFAFGLAVLAAIWLLCRRHLTRGAGVWAVAIYATLPLVTFVSSMPRVELGVALYSVLAVYAVFSVTESDGWGRFALAGVFAGLAAGTKTWGISVPLAVGALVLWHELVVRRRGAAGVLHSLLAFGLPAAVVGAPWYLRNWLASGDPIWPMGYPLFRGPFAQEWAYRKFSAWELGVGTGPIGYLLGFWNITNHVTAFGSQRVLSNDLLPPLLLAFIPGLLLIGRWGLPRRKVQIHQGLGIACLVVYTMWFFSGYQLLRYVQHMYPLLAIMAGCAVSRFLASPARPVRVTTAAAALFSFAVTFGFMMVYDVQFLPVVFGRESRDDFLARKVSHYNSLAWANQNLPSDAKVLLYGLSGWYYLDRDYWIANATYQGLIPFDELRTPEQFLETLQQMGITHVLIQAGSSGVARLEGRPGEAGAFLARLTNPPASVSDYERRAVLLLAALEAGGNMELIHVGRARAVSSRTLGGIREVEFAVYTLRDSQSVTGETNRSHSTTSQVN